jgi:hypothetical protein
MPWKRFHCSYTTPLSVQLHALAALPPEKESQVPTGQENRWDPELVCFIKKGSIAPHILDLSARWRGVVSLTHQPLHSQGVKRKYPCPCKESNTSHLAGNCHYTDWTTLAPYSHEQFFILIKWPCSIFTWAILYTYQVDLPHGHNLTLLCFSRLVSQSMYFFLTWQMFY